ncbi:hypothetical protein AB2L28_18230 [Kineococcus sp. TBRC 1896]|uniref:Uncharacterized protein n=1 Tax=Kineococcus mangrovi TaxID=1660183 RepID=A0ABV4I670_9ACTN
MRQDGQVTGQSAPEAEEGTQETPRETREEGREQGRGEVHGRWPSWVLVAACVVPPLLLAEAARRVLGGDYDEDFYGGYPSGSGAFDGAAPEITTGRRFGVLWALVEAPAPLWGGVVAALLVVAVVLAARPAALVPDRWGRRVAAGGAWLSAALALGGLLGVVQHATAPVDGPGPGALRFFLRTGLPDDLPGVAGALAVLVPAFVVPAAAGFVLWRGPGPVAVTAPSPGPGPRADEGGGPAPLTGVPPVAGPGDHHQDQKRVSEPDPDPDPTGPPAVPETERHLYRRPG